MRNNQPGLMQNLGGNYSGTKILNGLQVQNPLEPLTGTTISLKNNTRKVKVGISHSPSNFDVNGGSVLQQ